MPVSDWFKSSGVSSISLSSNRGIDKVLHGRVSKLSHTKTAPKVPKHKTFARDIKDEEDDEEVFEGIKLEEGYDDDDGDGDSEEESPIALPMAMMAQQADSEDSVPSQPPDPRESDNDDTDSESDKDTAWRLEQIYINMVLNARNEFPLMPSTWKMNFRGIPLPDSLFYDKEKSKSLRPRIFAHTHKLEYRGAYDPLHI